MKVTRMGHLVVLYEEGARLAGTHCVPMSIIFIQDKSQNDVYEVTQVEDNVR